MIPPAPASRPARNPRPSPAAVAKAVPEPGRSMLGVPTEAVGRVSTGGAAS